MVTLANDLDRQAAFITVVCSAYLNVYSCHADLGWW